MITLITILYAFLFPTNEVIMPDCQGKLEALNYTYEYDKEPAFENYGKDRGSNRYSIRYINENDSIPSAMKVEINTMYNCFKWALEGDTNKVLFISYYPLFDKEIQAEKTNEIQEIPNTDSKYQQLFPRRINSLIYYHDLKKHPVYYNMLSKEKYPKSRYKLELLDKTNPRIKAKSVKKWEVCKDCPF